MIKKTTKTLHTSCYIHIRLSHLACGKKDMKGWMAGYFFGRTCLHSPKSSQSAYNITATLAAYNSASASLKACVNASVKRLWRVTHPLCLHSKNLWSMFSSWHMPLNPMYNSLLIVKYPFLSPSFDDEARMLDTSTTYVHKVHMLTKHTHKDNDLLIKSHVLQFNPMSFWFL
jgi:hypothetical protein